MDAAVSELVAVLGVAVASSALGLVKHYTSALDGRVGGAIKPLQPALVALAGVALPYATAALGIAPVDPAVFVTAPTATIAAVTMREAAARLARRR